MKYVSELHHLKIIAVVRFFYGEVKFLISSMMKMMGKQYKFARIPQIDRIRHNRDV